MDDDTDDKDDSKRKSRNLSEKKRRDQFNLLVNELSSMVSSTNRKMDKSTVLKSTIAFLKHHNEITVRSRVHEIQEEWKPAFLSNEEFTHLILEALDGFIIVFSATGRIFYASESITSLLGHLPSDLLNMTIYDLTYEDDHSDLYNVLINPITILDPLQTRLTVENQVTFSCHLKRGGLDFKDEISFELVQFVGYFRGDVDIDNMLQNTRTGCYPGDQDTRLIFVGTGRIQTPQLIREMSIVDSSKSEFTSRHSLEWKFLFLDHRAPPIIGYLPFEVLGTSGYDYYHFDDLEKVIQCHEALMQKGEGTSCYYRFLTKGQQWIWLQTRFYITYHQWNSKPEFVVCTHRVVSYADVMKQTRNNNSSGPVTGDSLLDNSSANNTCNVLRNNEEGDSLTEKLNMQTSSSMIAHSPWSSQSSRALRSPSFKRKVQPPNYHHGNGSDSTSISADSPGSRHSIMTHHSATRQRIQHTNAHHHTQNQQRQQNLQKQDQQQMLVQHQLSVPTLHQAQSEMMAQQIHHQSRSLPAPPIMTPTFVEPQQYLAAIPVQPVIAAPIFTSTTTVMSPLQQPSDILPPGVVMTSTQTQIQDHLQRKHEELQQLIVQQQEELRRVSEQLLMARYGLLPSIENAPVSFNSSPVNVQSGNSVEQLKIQQPGIMTNTEQQQILQQTHHHQGEGSVLSAIDHQIPQPLEPVDQKSIEHGPTGPCHGDDMISYMQLTPVPTSHLQQMHLVSGTVDSQAITTPQHQQHLHHHQSHIPNELEVIPYQMSQQQSQILFNSTDSSRQN